LKPTLVIALLYLASVGCGGSSKSLFVYRDLRCVSPPPDGGTSQCQEVGDGASYVICAADGDCSAAAPFCRTLGLYSGGDFGCNRSVSICRTIDHDDCPH
jgi:hypothetical protein